MFLHFPAASFTGNIVTIDVQKGCQISSQQIAESAIDHRIPAFPPGARGKRQSLSAKGLNAMTVAVSMDRRG
jgi:hypothetical protein